MNVLILAAGNSGVDMHDGAYPLCLTELEGVPLIERLILGCSAISNAQFIVALRGQDIRRYHLDNIVTLLSPEATILRVAEDTRGAACTALLAASEIDNDEELLILNGNELIDINPLEVIAGFREAHYGAGTITFQSVHPRYSYVRLDETGLVVEAAEKNPISRHATAGFYWFAKGNDFVRAVQNMIRKDASVNGLFYICPALNELILEQVAIGVKHIEAKQYHPLKTERQLQQFEAAIDHRRV
ncbi:glycosyltransferase family 2 protein [Silvimonas amylolytica]|uniref:Glycosyl transferase family 2 n=1 Tax=Silvimonas amylolytica TaxID=449663 RepID=A0ABQ2PKD1_9NEIS|nr:glycosyltransferase family 2 protein [Silvimonas amylolytica]GGP25439.1 glycosyl transferase family 2 [Silvimonas amylolytica]